MFPNVSIIILNWNGWQDTIECLESVYQINYSNYNVILIDNGSEDESIEKIKEYCEGKIKVESKFFEYSNKNKPIKVIEYKREEAEACRGKEEISDLPSNRKLILIKNEKNYGFAEGNNIGMRYAIKALNPEYILLLNNDTVVDKNFLDELVKKINKNDDLGSCSPKILFYDKPRIINSTGILILPDGSGMDRGRNREDRGQYDKNIDIFGVCAAAAIYRVKALENTGFLDEEYFAYYEDVDISIRLRLNGWKCLYVPTAIVWHKYSKKSGAFSLFKIYQGERNRIWNVIKNFPFTKIVSSFPYNVVKLLLIILAYLKKEGRGIHYAKNNSLAKIFMVLLKAKIDAWKDMGNILRKRRKIQLNRRIDKKEIKEWFKKYSCPLKNLPYM